MAWIETDGGIALPVPALDSGKVSISTLVDGGRNQKRKPGQDRDEDEFGYGYRLYTQDSKSFSGRRAH